MPILFDEHDKKFVRAMATAFWEKINAKDFVKALLLAEKEVSNRNVDSYKK